MKSDTCNLADTPCKKVDSILQGHPTPRVHHVERLVVGVEQLGVVRHTTPSKQAGSSMRAWGHRSGSRNATVGLTWATTHSFDPGCCMLSVAHPVVLHYWLRCWDIHDDNSILPVPLVLAGDVRNHEHINGLPGTKPGRIIVGRWMLLLKNVAGDVLGYLNI